MADNTVRTFADTEGNYNFDNLQNYAPRGNTFLPTESLQHVQELMKKSKVIHIHGMSGSGKSKIVSGVCDDLCHRSRSQMIWQVQCSSSVGTIKYEWVKFAVQLLQSKLISKDEYEIALKAFRSGSYHDLKKFVDTLNKIPNLPPIVFVIEDVVSDDEKALVKNLVNCMHDFFHEILNLKILIATQDPHAIYSVTHLEALRKDKFYQTYEVKGFTPMEALDFLQYDGLVITDEAKVDKLASDLAYSPLGLLMAKSYCMEHRISYEEYWDTLGKGEHVEKEKELLKRYPDLGKHHRYEVIMRLFRPDDNDTEKHMQFKVMKMMSFVGNQQIPTPLLDRFFQQAKGEEVINQFAEKYLLTRLRKEVSASVEEDGSLLTLHADILRALNASMDHAEKREVLGYVVFAFASLLDKDNRTKPEYGLLHSLKQHAETVALHSADFFDELLSEEVQEKDFEILLGLSKLNEVIGFSISQHQGFRGGYEEEEFYQRAMDCIWVIVCANFGSGKNFLSLCWLPSWLISKKKKEEKVKQLINYEKDKDPLKTAGDIFKKVKEASVAKPSVAEALRKDWERLYPVKKANIDDMQACVGDGSKLDWDKMKLEITETGSISKRHCELLVKHGMIVEWEKLVKYYLTERLASILHSLGRMDNYKGDIIPPEMHESCMWYSDLGYHLCNVAANKTEVKSLFHYILQANNKLPRMVRNREGEDDHEFLQRISCALEIARNVKEETADYFEHGIYKRVSGTPFTLMNSLKYSVKAGTKVQKRPLVAKTVSVSQSNKNCAELSNLCRANPKIVIAGTCLVHAGKYLAATGKYIEALETFEFAFECGISERREKNIPAYCWALYNIGRAIVEGSKQVPIAESYVAKFKDRYEMTTKMNTPTKWRDLLNSMKEEVDTLA